MPKQLSADELEAEIKEVIAGLSEGANIGAVMKAAKEKIGARSDGKSISECAKRLLG